MNVDTTLHLTIVVAVFLMPWRRFALTFAYNAVQMFRASNMYVPSLVEVTVTTYVTKQTTNVPVVEGTLVSVDDLPLVAMSEIMP